MKPGLIPKSSAAPKTKALTFHLPSTPQEIALIGDALEGSGTVPPPTPPEDDEAR